MSRVRRAVSNSVKGFPQPVINEYDVPMGLEKSNIVVAITGASGALYAQRFLQGLALAGVNVHLVVSPLGRRLLNVSLNIFIR